MADEILVFDAAASGIGGTDPGSPLSIGPGTSYTLAEASFPAPPLNVQYASSIDTEGELAVSRRYGNREITLRVEMDESGANDTLLNALQVKFAKLQSEGGTLKRTRKDGTTIRIYDIIAADGWSPSYDHKYLLGHSSEVTMVLPARPLARGAEVDLGDNTETTLPALVFTEATVAGDVPALGRLVVDNDVAAAQHTMLWGVQSKEYNAASTAALFFEAEALTRVTGVLDAGPAGASGGANKTVKQTGSGTAIVEGTFTSAGEFRLFARVQAPSANTGTVTLGVRYYRTGDISSTANATVEINPAQEAHWLVVDLGPIVVPRAPTGTHAWTLFTEETMTSGSDVLHYDWFLLLPVIEGSGRLSGNGTSSATAAVPSSSSVTVRDDALWIGANGGRPYKYEGDYLRVPPSGAEARTVRFIVKLSRGLVYVSGASGSAYYDDSTDDLSARLFVTPRFLT